MLVVSEGEESVMALHLHIEPLQIKFDAGITMQTQHPIILLAAATQYPIIRLAAADTSFGLFVDGVSDLLIGMAHRCRLNLLTVLLEFPLVLMFQKVHNSYVHLLAPHLCMVGLRSILVREPCI